MKSRNISSNESHLSTNDFNVHYSNQSRIGPIRLSQSHKSHVGKTRHHLENLEVILEEHDFFTI